MAAISAVTASLPQPPLFSADTCEPGSMHSVGSVSPNISKDELWALLRKWHGASSVNKQIFRQTILQLGVLDVYNLLIEYLEGSSSALSHNQDDRLVAADLFADLIICEVPWVAHQLPSHAELLAAMLQRVRGGPVADAALPVRHALCRLLAHRDSQYQILLVFGGVDGSLSTIQEVLSSKGCPPTTASAALEALCSVVQHASCVRTTRDKALPMLLDASELLAALLPQHAPLRQSLANILEAIAAWTGPIPCTKPCSDLAQREALQPDIRRNVLIRDQPQDERVTALADSALPIAVAHNLHPEDPATSISFLRFLLYMTRAAPEVVPRLLSTGLMEVLPPLVAGAGTAEPAMLQVCSALVLSVAATGISVEVLGQPGLRRLLLRQLPSSSHDEQAALLEVLCSDSGEQLLPLAPDLHNLLALLPQKPASCVQDEPWLVKLAECLDAVTRDAEVAKELGAHCARGGAHGMVLLLGVGGCCVPACRALTAMLQASEELRSWMLQPVDSWSSMMWSLCASVLLGMNMGFVGGFMMGDLLTFGLFRPRGALLYYTASIALMLLAGPSIPDLDTAPKPLVPRVVVLRVVVLRTVVTMLKDVLSPRHPEASTRQHLPQASVEKLEALLPLCTALLNCTPATDRSDLWLPRAFLSDVVKLLCKIASGAQYPTHIVRGAFTALQVVKSLPGTMPALKEASPKLLLVAFVNVLARPSAAEQAAEVLGGAAAGHYAGMRVLACWMPQLVEGLQAEHRGQQRTWLLLLHGVLHSTGGSSYAYLALDAFQRADGARALVSTIAVLGSESVATVNLQLALECMLALLCRRSRRQSILDGKPLDALEAAVNCCDGQERPATACRLAICKILAIIIRKGPRGWRQECKDKFGGAARRWMGGDDDQLKALGLSYLCQEPPKKSGLRRVAACAVLAALLGAGLLRFRLSRKPPRNGNSISTVTSQRARRGPDDERTQRGWTVTIGPLDRTPSRCH